MMPYGLSSIPWFASLMMVAGVLAWAVVVAIVVWAASRLFAGRSASDEETALEILRKRYARGELSAAEFQRAKHDLT